MWTARRGGDRVLEHPGPAEPRLAVDGGDLPLSVRPAPAGAAGLARGPALRLAVVGRAPGPRPRRRVLRRRSDPVASLDRGRRRRPRHRAGQHPGGTGAAGGMGRAGREAGGSGAGRAADRADRSRPHLGCAPAWRVRPGSGTWRAVRPGRRRGLRRLPAPAATRRVGSAARRGSAVRCDVDRDRGLYRRRRDRRRRGSDSGLAAGGVADRARADLAGARAGC